jgi:hypothetical protein
MFDQRNNHHARLHHPIRKTFGIPLNRAMGL